VGSRISVHDLVKLRCEFCPGKGFSPGPFHKSITRGKDLAAAIHRAPLYLSETCNLGVYPLREWFVAALCPIANLGGAEVL